MCFQSSLGTPSHGKMPIGYLQLLTLPYRHFCPSTPSVLLSCVWHSAVNPVTSACSSRGLPWMLTTSACLLSHQSSWEILWWSAPSFSEGFGLHVVLSDRVPLAPAFRFRTLGSPSSRRINLGGLLSFMTADHLVRGSESASAPDPGLGPCLEDSFIHGLKVFIFLYQGGGDIGCAGRRPLAGRSVRRVFRSRRGSRCRRG